ncbi:unnamed protein product [Prunus brigantina]
MLQLSVPGKKMVTPLRYLDDTGAKELHLGLEIDLCRRSPLGGTLLGGWCWAPWLSLVGIAEWGVKKRRRGRIGEGACWAEDKNKGSSR